jgi:hypothetical protein
VVTYSASLGEIKEILIFKYVSPFSRSCLQLREKGEIDMTAKTESTVPVMPA